MNKRIPTYRHHKQSGQAIVTLTDGLGGRRDVLLGKYGSADSRAEYLRVIAQWEASGNRLPQPSQTGPADISVNELILAYYQFATTYYVKNGEPTSQLNRVRLSLKPVKDLYGHTLVKDFGPLSLKAVRQTMLKAGNCRRYINACVGCVRRMFKWGVEEELVPPSVFHGLQAVSGLKKGRSQAPESQPILPVDEATVLATLPFLTPPVRAMVQLQRLAGMRPGEVVIMRPCDLDKSRNTVWLYRPESHKTEHHGVERLIVLGPQAMEVLKPFLDRDPGAYCFSPREAMAKFREEQRAARKTPVQPCQVNRRKSRLKKQPREHYGVDTYDQAIAKAAARAKVPHWHPHQLRHSAATEIREAAGLDAAQAVLGHRQLAATQVYAQNSLTKAEEVMERLG